MRRGLLALSLAAVLPVAMGAQGDEVLVSAAASLSDVLQDLGRAYRARTGVTVTVNTGASNTLARQINAGAGVDVFISADEAQMDAVLEQTVTDTRIDLLSNQLAVAVPADRPRTLNSAGELAGPAFSRIAIGDPAAVPAGRYAKAYLEELGIWRAIERKTIPTASVRLALAAVENGAADAAIVYRTDITASRRTSVALLVPAADGPRIVYPAAVMRNGRNRSGAVRFLSWLKTAEAARIFRTAGFVPLAEPDTARPRGTGPQTGRMGQHRVE